jgi:hypothetical protein
MGGVGAPTIHGGRLTKPLIAASNVLANMSIVRGLIRFESFRAEKGSHRSYLFKQERKHESWQKRLRVILTDAKK